MPNGPVQITPDDAMERAQSFYEAMEAAIDRGDLLDAHRQFEQGWFWHQEFNRLTDQPLSG